METAVWVAIIGGVTTVIAVSIPLLVSAQNKRMKKERIECKRELAEMRKEYKKAIELAIEKSRNL